MENDEQPGSRRVLGLAAGIIIVTGLLLLLSKTASDPTSSASSSERGVEREGQPPGARRGGDATERGLAPAPYTERTAERIVARKLAQFGASRREFAHELARRRGVPVSADVERFFDAVEAGNWEEIKAAFDKINGGDSSAGHSSNRDPELTWIWPAIIDAYGAAEQVHDWPAQQLLDYGNAILETLKPGMVYVGGTDNGRWIPSLLNDTSDGERHVVITQNGLADATYLEYLRVQYADRLDLLTDADSGKAFRAYIADAQQRLSHDQNNPNAPRKIRPGEDIKITEGRVSVSGLPAVMAVNENLLKILLEKNPGISFGMQESFPFTSVYGDAVPLGPIMELRARTQDGADPFTQEAATASLDYWRNRASQAGQPPPDVDSSSMLKSYSHDAAAAANLLAAKGYAAQAEEAYRLSMQMWPENPQPTAHLAALLAREGKTAQAERLLADFEAKHPGQREALRRLQASPSPIP